VIAQYLRNEMRYGGAYRDKKELLRSTAFVKTKPEGKGKNFLQGQATVVISQQSVWWNRNRDIPPGLSPFSNRPRDFIPLIAWLATATYVTEYLNLEPASPCRAASQFRAPSGQDIDWIPRCTALHSSHSGHSRTQK
jgi:hypothetical protein